MTARSPPPAARRPFWTRNRLLAVCVAGVVAVIVIANTHPWSLLEPAPSIELASLGVTMVGSGAGGVHAASTCANQCPVRANVGSTVTVSFLVVPYGSITCTPSVYYTITKVTQTSTGAFTLTGVTANSGAKLPVTLPDPVGGSTCQTSDEIFVSFSVANQGPSTQTPTVQVTVTQS